MFKSFEVVPFHAHQILTAREGDEILVPLRPIVESMGMAWNAQFERVKRHPVLSEGVRITRTPSQGGMQDTTCLTLEMLPGFLATIETSRIKDPAVRERVTLFQREAFHALFVHFFGGKRSTLTGAPPSTSDLLRLVTSVKGESNLEIRAMLHTHLGQLCSRLDLPLPAIEAFGQPSRSDREIAEAFFAALLELQALGIDFNHHRRPELLAVSLPQLRSLLRGAGIDCPSDRVLWKALPLHPAFESTGGVNCRDGHTRKCWVFRRIDLTGFT